MNKNLYIIKINNDSIKNRLIHRGYRSFEIFNDSDPWIVVDKISKTFFSCNENELDDVDIKDIGHYFYNNTIMFFNALDYKS